jgi:endonuclease/exonuclease/phosphatase family metal-dependent hydrolase
MRVVSVNAWGGAMYDVLIPWLTQVKADVVCVQEVTRSPGTSGWATFTDGERTLPQRLNLLDDVSTALRDHAPHFIANDSGPVVDAEGVTWRQDFGIATWVRDRFPVIGLDARFVHSHYIDHADWVQDRPRAALAATVRDRDIGRTVSVIQLHGLRDPAGKHDTSARREQARRLAELVDRVRSMSDLTVLCGDLNLLPNSETFGLLRDVGMVDLVGNADTRTSRYTKPIRSANYMLVSSQDAVSRFEVLSQPEVSDHRALLLEI